MSHHSKQLHCCMVVILKI